MSRIVTARCKLPFLRAIKDPMLVSLGVNATYDLKCPNTN